MEVFARDYAITPEDILIKCYDSIEDGSVAVLTPHTAFENPTASEGSPFRESIELRALVVPVLDNAAGEILLVYLSVSITYPPSSRRHCSHQTLRDNVKRQLNRSEEVGQSRLRVYLFWRKHREIAVKARLGKPTKWNKLKRILFIMNTLLTMYSLVRPLDKQYELFRSNATGFGLSQVRRSFLTVILSVKVSGA
ncbi:tetraspanin tsp2 family [Moniliophthora roreri]|nr:tetraspanin tsp2 family [Moniliophthora roreri]